MSTIQQSIRDLSALMTGGLQIITGLDGRPLTVPEQNSPYTGKQFETKGIRTIIQPDMDVMTMLSPEVFGVDGLWEQHTAVVDQKLSIIYKAQRWLQQSWMLFMLIPASLFIYDYNQIDFSDVWVYALKNLIIAGIIYLLKGWIARILSWAGGRYLHAQFQKYLG